MKVDNIVKSIAYSPDGSKLAAAHNMGVSIFNVETNKVLCIVTCHSSKGQHVSSVSWAPDGQRLVSGSIEKTVSIWEAATGKELSQLSCDSPVLSIGWHDNRIVAGCYSGTINVFDAQSGDCLSTVKDRTTRL